MVINRLRLMSFAFNTLSEMINPFQMSASKVYSYTIFFEMVVSVLYPCLPY